MSIERILVTQIHVLESMAPIGFLEFRDKLNPASGFQSMQFRELEFASGAKDEKILATFKEDEFAYERLKRRFSEPTLADSFWAPCHAADLRLKRTRQRRGNGRNFHASGKVRRAN
ncbi:MAG: hypothetical protein IPK98_10960 [Chloracidobacterium sp.]|nr:hypothetical protein [Chloracidobacterium sp.]